MVSKTKAQITTCWTANVHCWSNWYQKVAENETAPEPIHCPSLSASSSKSYAVRFIQHAPEQPTEVYLELFEVDHCLSQRPEMGYALKHGPGKRTLFTQI